jgi:hypothetical protein
MAEKKRKRNEKKVEIDFEKYKRKHLANVRLLRSNCETSVAPLGTRAEKSRSWMAESVRPQTGCSGGPGTIPGGLIPSRNYDYCGKGNSVL